MVTPVTYQTLSLEDSSHQWELFDGGLREKPPMNYVHNHVMSELGGKLMLTLSEDAFEVRINCGRLQRGARSYFIPDIMVIPNKIVESHLQVNPDALEIYAEPLLLVVEVWSHPTLFYDVDDKLPEYRARGDLEIWRLHPYERTLTAWRRRPDGGYDESFQKGGVVHPVGLPNVAIDLDDLFDLG